ncbi:MAG: tetratricopeptide repeat protein [Nocardioides sp.]
MSDAAESYDVFLSYNWDDRRHVLPLVEALEREGLEVFRDETGMRDYDDIGREIVAALNASRSLVAFMTKSFPDSVYCRWEVHTALTKAYRLDGDTERIMTVLHDVDFDEVRPRRLTGLRLPDRETALEALAASVAAKVAELDGRAFGEALDPPPLRWWPVPGAAFKVRGREGSLWDLHDALHAAEDAESSGPALARVVGVGGIGKTLLAEEYARSFAADHPGGVFVFRGYGSHLHQSNRLMGVAGLHREQVRSLASAVLAQDITNLNDEVVSGLLAKHLSELGPYLWIVDDVPADLDTATFRSLLAPTPNGRTLVTSRDPREALGGQIVTLNGLDRLGAVGLLTSRRVPRGRAERDAAAALAVTDLGGHPQALALASALTADADFTSYAALRTDLASPEPDTLELAGDLHGELPGGHEPSIAATLLRSIAKASDRAREILEVASVLGPAPLPVDLVANTIAAVANITADEASECTKSGLDEATLRSLARPAGSSLWEVHALVARTVRFVRRAEGQPDAVRGAAVWVLTAALDQSRGEYTHRGLVDLLPHVRALAGDLAEETDWRVFNEAARVHIESGDPRPALNLYADLHQACEAALGEDHDITLSALAGLGIAYGVLGDHDTALPLKTRVYQGLAKTLGADHPDVLTALNNVAVTHDDLGQYAAALERYRQVYRTRRRLLSIHHRDTLDALANLGVATGRLGQHRLALRLKQAAAARLRVLLGPDSPASLDALNNVGASMVALQRLDEARGIFADVLEGRRSVLGEHHPDTLSARENLVLAAPKLDRAVLGDIYAARVAGQGPGHPDTIRTLRNLVCAWTDGRDRSGFEPVAVLTSEILVGRPRLDTWDVDLRIAIFTAAAAAHQGRVDADGPDHPDTLRALCRLAHATALLDQLDAQLDNAAVLAADAAEGLADELGARHPDAALAAAVHAWISDCLEYRDDP